MFRDEPPPGFSFTLAPSRISLHLNLSESCCEIYRGKYGILKANPDKKQGESPDYFKGSVFLEGPNAVFFFAFTALNVNPSERVCNFIAATTGFG